MDRYGKFGELASSPPTSQPANPVRGCGTLKKGGFYLQAEGGPGGTLNRTTWVLGTHVFNTGLWMQDNIFVDAPPRSMQYINPAATLVKGNVVDIDIKVKMSKSEGVLYENLVHAVGTFGVLDHVGSAYYPTPFEFADEVWQYGPSRKVPETMIRWLSDNGMFPVPVFFAHSRMPMFSTISMRETIFKLACKNVGHDPAGPDWQYGPTWLKARKGWGMTTESTDTGGNHYLIPILKSLSQFKEAATNMFTATGRDTGIYHQTMFLASWFTRGAYVLKDENDPGMHGTGIINIDIDKEIITHGTESGRS
jgi:hypothetical protein